MIFNSEIEGFCSNGTKTFFEAIYLREYVKGKATERQPLYLIQFLNNQDFTIIGLSKFFKSNVSTFNTKLAKAANK